MKSEISTLTEDKCIEWINQCLGLCGQKDEIRSLSQFTPEIFFLLCEKFFSLSSSHKIAKNSPKIRNRFIQMEKVKSYLESLKQKTTLATDTRNRAFPFIQSQDIIDVNTIQIRYLISFLSRQIKDIPDYYSQKDSNSPSSFLPLSTSSTTLTTSPATHSTTPVNFTPKFNLPPPPPSTKTASASTTASTTSITSITSTTATKTNYITATKTATSSSSSSSSSLPMTTTTADAKINLPPPPTSANRRKNSINNNIFTSDHSSTLQSPSNPPSKSTVMVSPSPSNFSGHKSPTVKMVAVPPIPLHLQKQSSLKTLETSPVTDVSTSSSSSSLSSSSSSSSSSMASIPTLSSSLTSRSADSSLKLHHRIYSVSSARSPQTSLLTERKIIPMTEKMGEILKNGGREEDVKVPKNLNNPNNQSNPQSNLTSLTRPNRPVPSPPVKEKPRSSSIKSNEIPIKIEPVDMKIETSSEMKSEKNNSNVSGSQTTRPSSFSFESSPQEKQLYQDFIPLDFKLLRQVRQYISNPKSYTLDDSVDLLVQLFTEKEMGEECVSKIINKQSSQSAISSSKLQRMAVLSANGNSINSNSTSANIASVFTSSINENDIPLYEISKLSKDEEIVIIMKNFVRNRLIFQEPKYFYMASTNVDIKTQREFEILYRYRNILIKEPKLFVKIIHSVIYIVGRHQQEKLDEKELQIKKLFKLIPISTLTKRLNFIDSLEILLSRPLSEIDDLQELAINILEKYSEVSHLFLLQLVQCLRNEKYENIIRNKSKITNFLLGSCSKSFQLANLFNWYLVAECESISRCNNIPGLCDTFSTIRYQFLDRLKGSNPEILDLLVRQQLLIQEIQRISLELKNGESAEVSGTSTLTRHQKIGRLRNFLKTKQNKWNEIFQNQFYLPLNPEQPVYGFQYGNAKIFKSAQEPLGLSFRITPDEYDPLSISDSYIVLFKMGDDLRQDQLVQQLFHFLNRILLCNGLDLLLEPLYKVIATGFDTGMVEIVPASSTISSILDSNNGSIEDFLKKCSSKTCLPLHTILTNYVKTTAGYSVLTYILGVGDRHLDNLLITNEGKLFHIDFGFILGRDPKPFPPPMRLTTEMLQGMGGTHTQYYVAFQVYCCQAYKILRRNAHIILLMLHAMMGARLDSMMVTNSNPDMKCVKRIVEKNLKLKLTDNEADSHMIDMIQSSSKMIIPKITEQFHKIAQSLRD